MQPAVSVSLFGLLISVSAIAAPVQEADLSATTLAPNAHIADSSRCDSIPPIGWRVDTLFGSVTIEPADALPDGWGEMLLDGIREHLHVPQAASLPFGGGPDDLPPGAPSVVSPVIMGQVIASLDRVGVLGSPQISASTFSTEVDRSLLSAMRELAATGTIPPFPEDVRADSVRIRFTVEEHLDSIERRHAKPLNVLRNPIWTLESPVWAMKGNPAPRYPRVAELNGVEDEVLVSFVVDEEGKAHLGTARVLKGRYREFQLTVLELIPRLRFHSARVEGCPVAQLVQMPFSFRTRG